MIGLTQEEYKKFFGTSGPQSAQEPPQDTDRLFRLSAIEEYKITGDICVLAEALMQDEDGGIVALGEIQKEMLNFIEEHPGKNLNIELPVGSGKTNLAAVYCANRFIKNRQYTCLYLSESDSVAKVRMQKIYELILKYSELSGEQFKFSAKNTTEFRLAENNNVDNSIVAKNIESSYMGAHVSDIILDDVETVNTAPRIQTIIEEHYQKKVLNRLSKKGRIIAINTPYHINGLLARLEKEHGWITLKIAMKEELIKEALLPAVEAVVKEYFQDPIEKDKALKLFESRLLINLAELIEEKAYEGAGLASKTVRACLDFSYTKQIIKGGELIEEEQILPPWPYFVKREGESTLAKFLSAPSAYFMTYALNPAKGLETNIFTAHKEALVPAEKLQAMRAEGSHTTAFTYDMSTTMRAGTVIIEAAVFPHTAVVLSMTKEGRGSDAIEENIRLYQNAVHVPEANGMQAEIIRRIENELPEECRKNIIRHYTTQDKNDMIRGVQGMNRQFKTGEILFLENGEGIPELLNMLSAYTGKKTKKEQFDPIDALYFLAYNLDRIRRIRIRPAAPQGSRQRPRPRTKFTGRIL